ncbi:hypothetical protein Q7C36_007418 [Tachysurus vachellii]|uniref:Uncharacterized protein n=1 Tax=Tachysurus vachellii TaxID=175792 RepID=A0AA88N6N1_TACVA|nr:hypothetical protein Q7C36_007418 [Tachysurus vachellii]
MGEYHREAEYSPDRDEAPGGAEDLFYEEAPSGTTGNPTDTGPQHEEHHLMQEDHLLELRLKMRRPNGGGSSGVGAVKEGEIHW